MRVTGALLFGLVACQPQDSGAPVPRAQAPGADCSEVVARVHQAVDAQVAQVGSAAHTLVDKMLPAMQQSCEHDGWPAELRACIVTSAPGDMQAMQRCTTAMTPELQAKLQRRMLQAAPSAH